MNTQKSSLPLAFLIAATASLASVPVTAQENLNFAYGTPADSGVGHAVVGYISAVAERTDGEIAVTAFPMTLLTQAEASPGIRDGLADVGLVVTGYYPAEYSTNLFLHELNTLVNLPENPNGKEALAFSGAMLEYTFMKCPECLDEYTAQNQVYTGGAVTPLYNLLCKGGKVTSLDDLKGKRFRAGGAGFVRFAEHFGATGVSIPLSETYEALDQGIVECAMLSAPELDNFSLHEVVTDVTLGVPGGVYAAIASANVNKDLWLSMTDAKREALLWGGTKITAGITWGFYSDDGSAIQNAKDKGINVHQPDAELKAAVKDFVRQDLGTVSTLFKEKYNVLRADEIATEFSELLEKWYVLTEDVGSEQELHNLFWEQIVSKVDPATYMK